MRIIRRILAGLLSVILIVWNVGVHRAPVIGSEEERAAVLSQLDFLGTRVHGGLGAEMQQLFPEGRLFTHVLYGLSWCGLAHGSTDNALRDRAFREAEWAYAQLNSAEEQALFEGSMIPVNGAFYNGWSNFLLARIIEMEGSDGDHALIAAFDSLSVQLAQAFNSSASPFLPSYPGQAWPADNVVAMASVALHQELRKADHRAVIARWVQHVRATLDPKGSIGHAWDMQADRIREDARGSSQSMMNCFLPVIDSSLAKEQFDRYKERFIDSRLGVPMVREYPKSSNGRGDVDSGPVVFGVGFSATILGPGACRMNNALPAAGELDGTIEGFGSPTGDQKRYVFGKMPIADLFIAWTRTMAQRAQPYAKSASFLAFHLWSLVVAAILWSPTLVALWKRRR